MGIDLIFNFLTNFNRFIGIEDSVINKHRRVKSDLDKWGDNLLEEKKTIIQRLQKMINRRVINNTRIIIPILVYKLFLRSGWVAHFFYNIFKTKKDISINATVNKDSDIQKYNNKLEICY